MSGGYETRGTYRGNGATGAGVANATPQSQATGAPARIYMNEKIVPYLLEGMKMVAKDQWVFILLFYISFFGVLIYRFLKKP